MAKKEDLKLDLGEVMKGITLNAETGGGEDRFKSPVGKTIREEQEDNEDIIDPSDIDDLNILQDDDDEPPIPEIKDDDEDELTTVKDDDSDSNLDGDVADMNDLSEYEPQIASYLEEKLYDKFGWNLEEEDKRAENIDSIVDLLYSVVEEYSKPEYSSEEVGQLDAFVKNGGNLRDYFTTRYSEDLDIENVDLNSEVSQQRVLREYFKSQGYSDDKIEKRIQRYDDVGTLADEAEDALDLLKKDKTQKAEKLLVEQENLRKQQVQQQQKFIGDVTSYIDSLQDIVGVPLTKKVKDKLKVNLLRVGEDGLTEYQRKYNESLITNLVESVFLTTMRDTYKNGSTKAAQSKAAQELKKKLLSAKNNPKQKGGAGEQRYTQDNELLRQAAGMLQ